MSDERSRDEWEAVKIMGRGAWFAIRLALCSFLSFLWYGLSLEVTARILSRDVVRVGEAEVRWLYWVGVHLVIRSGPSLSAAFAFRRRYGLAFSATLVLSLILVAWLDGGHLVRRAYWGKV